jgi:hypothetical protein
LSVLLSFGHCVVCSSVFWSLCCLFFCLLAIVLSVLLRFTDSDYPFGIFKLFWLNFNLLPKPSNLNNFCIIISKAKTFNFSSVSERVWVNCLQFPRD